MSDADKGLCLLVAAYLFVFGLLGAACGLMLDA